MPIDSSLVIELAKEIIGIRERLSALYMDGKSDTDFIAQEDLDRLFDGLADSAFRIMDEPGLIELRERPNSIETHRNNKGEWSVTSKVYFGNSQEDAEAAVEWLADLNLRLMLAYPPVDDVQAEVLTKRLERSLTAASERVPSPNPDARAAPLRRVPIAEGLDKRVNERLANERAGRPNL